VRCLKIELSKSGMKLVGKPLTLMQLNYRPKLDVLPILGPEQANYFQSIIGVL